MQKIIHINPDRCVACRICEIACSFQNHGEINPAKSRIRINMFHKEFRFIPVVCSQCDDAWCVNSCPKDALQKDQMTGVVKLIESECVGCKMCIKACPFGAMGYVSETKLANKCDFCGGNPACVANCFYGALEYAAVETGVAHKCRVYAKKILHAYKDENLK